jgi:hypothetical protein
MISKITFVSILAVVIAAFTFDTAAARKRYAVRNAYDGWWNISIVTRRGSCSRFYQFQVQISNGILIFQGPASITGRVSSCGSVRVSVWAGAKRASGYGRRSRRSGSDRWSGRSRTSRCSGYWTARRY